MLHPCGTEASPMVDTEQEDFLLGTDDAADNVGMICVQAGKELQYSPWAKVNDPTPMVQPHYLPIRPHQQQQGPPTMGRLEIGTSSLADINTRHKTRVLRGKEDCREQEKRTFARCVLHHHGTNGWRCNGQKGGRNAGQKACEFFNAVGFLTFDFALM